MVQVADASVVIRGDLNKFKGDLAGAGKQVDTLGAKFKSALTPGNLLAAGGVAFGAAQVVSFLGDAVQAAGEFEDTVSATGVIFERDAIPALEAWADEAAVAFGASKQDALEAANSFAVFGKSAGLVGDQLAEFSKGLVERAGDLASMFGGTTQEAILAVGSALRGEFEPIRRYGVLLDDATLRQKAFEMGLISTTKNALTPQQRVLAAQQAVLEQSSIAAGNYADTSEGMMNSQKTLQAELENVTIEIGEKLLPVMVEFVHFVSDVGIPVITEFMDMLDDLGDTKSAEGIPVLSQLEDAFNATGDAALVFGSFIRMQENDVRAVADALGTDFITAHQRIQRIMEQTGDDFETVTERLKGGLKEVSGDVATILPQSIKQATSSVGEAAAEMADQIPGAMEEAKAEAEAIARSTPGALANQLRAGIEEYDEALEELADVAANSVSDLAERQKIEGILASQELTDALNSDSTRTRLLAQDLVADLVSDYELLAPGALRAGSHVNPSLSSGIRSNLGLTRDAAAAVVDAAGNPLVDLGNQAYGWGQTLSRSFHDGMLSYLWAIRQVSVELGDAAASGIRLRSPAEEGPLSEPADRWGLKLGKEFASGMWRSIPTIHGASLAMAGAAVPTLGSSPLATANGSVLPTSGDTKIYQLYTDGVRKDYASPREMVNDLERMGDTWG